MLHIKKTWKSITCYNCGNTVTSSIKNHIRGDCPAIGKKCTKCEYTGHFAQYCKKSPDVQHVQSSINQNEAPTPAEEEDAYNINIFQIDASNSGNTENIVEHPTNYEEQPPSGRLKVDYDIDVFTVKSAKNRVLPKLKSNVSTDFRATVVINNCIGKPIADTGAKKLYNYVKHNSL